ncbi:protein LLP homolog [Onthophagus taurus]|uniref:protein LLP homolog n=1 Tax=Onthophagus taurus TaxID=166361 RepID=UPI0039BE2EAF
MAKSLRSKWRRKCRAVKRERYGQKELDRLKKTLGIDEKNTDVTMTDIAEIATVTDAKTIKEKKNVEEKEDEMVMDTAGKRVFNSKTMKDQFGNYPVWMNQRKVQKHRKGEKKRNKRIGKNKKRSN